MKKKFSPKKLSLKKITIAQIDNSVQNSLVGGTGYNTCAGYTDGCGGYPTYAAGTCGNACGTGC